MHYMQYEPVQLLYHHHHHHQPGHPRCFNEQAMVNREVRDTIGDIKTTMHPTQHQARETATQADDKLTWRARGLQRRT